MAKSLEQTVYEILDTSGTPISSVNESGNFMANWTKRSSKPKDGINRYAVTMYYDHTKVSKKNNSKILMALKGQPDSVVSTYSVFECVIESSEDLETIVGRLTPVIKSFSPTNFDIYDLHS